MRTLKLNEVVTVGGGEVGATGMGDNYHYTGVDPQACATAIMFWSGVGAAVGAFGGAISALGGWAVGGYFGSYAGACQH